MTSILTNTGAMVALATLTQTNKSLTETQGQIATGKKVDNASQNAAIWAVTQVMEQDVDGFNAISDSLSLGKAAVTVARNASEKINDLLVEVKEKVITAQGDNVDRSKIQTDITELSNQVESIVSAAQFNGLNLIDGSQPNADIKILASLDRSRNGVTSSNITVGLQNLSRTAGTFGEDNATNSDYLIIGESGTNVDNAKVSTDNATLDFALTAANAVTDAMTIAIGDSYSYTSAENWTSTAADDWGAEFAALVQADINAQGLQDNFSVSYDSGTDKFTVENKQRFAELDVTFSAAAGAPIDGAQSNAGQVEESALNLTIKSQGTDGSEEGDSYRVTLGSETYEYIAQDGDDINDIAVALTASINYDDAFAGQGLVAQVVLSDDVTTNDAHILLDVDSGEIAAEVDADTGGTAGGVLGTLGSMDVTTTAGANSALEDIERLIQLSIDAASAFGSSEKRLDIQSDFVDSLVDSVKTGVGALVDTDMEEASARLQALQVQQQLGTQALSIANSAPQNIMSLFR